MPAFVHSGQLAVRNAQITHAVSPSHVSALGFFVIATELMS